MTNVPHTIGSAWQLRHRFCTHRELSATVFRPSQKSSRRALDSCRPKMCTPLPANGHMFMFRFISMCGGMEVRMEAYTNNANKYTIAYENSMSNINGKNDKNT